MYDAAQQLTVQAAEANSISEYPPLDSVLAHIPTGTTKSA